MRSKEEFLSTDLDIFFPFANVISNMHICSHTLLAKTYSLLAASFCLFTASSIPTGFGNLDKFNGCLYGRRRWLCVWVSTHAVWLWVIHNLKLWNLYSAIPPPPPLSVDYTYFLCDLIARTHPIVVVFFMFVCASDSDLNVGICLDQNLRCQNKLL